MPKKKSYFYLLRWCLLFACYSAFSQKQIYKSDFSFKNFQSKKFLDSIVVANNKIHLNNSQNQTQINNTNNFVLTEKQLLVLDSNKKEVLQLDLETEFPTDNFEPDAYSAIIAATAESVWFCYQKFTGPL